MSSTHGARTSRILTALVGLSTGLAALVLPAASAVPPPDAWGPPHTVVQDVRVTSSTADVTTRGREVVTYVSRGDRSQLFATTRAAGGQAWTPPTALSTRVGSLESAQLVTWGDGRATAVWAVGCCRVRFRYRDMQANGHWGEQKAVDLPPVSAAFNVQVGRAPDGTFVIAWSRGEGRGAQAAVRFPGRPWRATGEHPLVDSRPTGVVVDRRGDVHVAVYQETADDRMGDTRADGRGVYLLDVDTDGTWGAQHRVGPAGDVYLQEYGQYGFSVNSSADLLLTWGEYIPDGDLRYVMRVRYDGGGFGPRQVLARPSSEFDSQLPVAAMTRSGGVVTVYGIATSESTSQLYLRRLTADGSWLAPRLITPDPQGYHSVDQVAVSPRGTVLITYSRRSESGDVETRVLRCLRAKRCGQGADFPSLDRDSLVAMGPEGRGLLVTRQPTTGDPAHSDLVARRLASAER